MKWMMLLLVVVHAGSAIADQFHYNNVLIGDRASGLGGAFTAVSDDASGVHYNPAGLAFALSNDISGSANAFYSKEVTYKDAAYGSDFVESSGGSMAPFVGVLGKLEHISPGMVFGFGIISIDSDLKDQDSLIAPGGDIRFHRTANIRANTGKIAAAVAKRFGGSFAVGFGASFLSVDELSQIYQDVTEPRYALDANGDRDKTKPFLRNLTQNTRESLQANGIEPTLGFQYAFLDRFSVGLNIKKTFLLWEHYDMSFERSVQYFRITDGEREVVDVENTDVFEDGVGRAADPNRAYIDSSSSDHPFGDWPMEVRSGFAWFASTSTMITADITYYTAVDSDVNQFDKDAVTNFALGTEYYITPSVPVRLGFFTNNDARPMPQSGKANQPDSINYVGSSLYCAFVTPNSQIAVGGVLQEGKGKAQKVANSTQIQDVEALAWTLGFSVSHNF